MGSGPKLVIFGAILGCMFLSILLYKLTEGISYVAAASEFGDQADTSNDFVSGGKLAASSCAVSGSYPTTVLQWCELITLYAEKHGLAPDLVAALIWQESGGNASAYSRSGAVGLMQVMPRDGLAATFMCKNGPCFSTRPTTEQLKDPEFNIAFGTQMLAGLLKRSGNLREALKSYGPMDVGYYYADKVLGLAQQYGR